MRVVGVAFVTGFGAASFVTLGRTQTNTLLIYVMLRFSAKFTTAHCAFFGCFLHAECLMHSLFLVIISLMMVVVVVFALLLCAVPWRATNHSHRHPPLPHPPLSHLAP